MAVNDASYCTLFPENAPDEQKLDALELSWPKFLSLPGLGKASNAFVSE